MLKQVACAIAWTVAAALFGTWIGVMLRLIRRKLRERASE